MIENICKRSKCQKPFIGKRIDARYCSKQCARKESSEIRYKKSKTISRECPGCGTTFVTRAHRGRKYCTKKCGATIWRKTQYIKDNVEENRNFAFPDYSGENIEPGDGGRRNWSGRPSLIRPI